MNSPKIEFVTFDQKTCNLQACSELTSTSPQNATTSAQDYFAILSTIQSLPMRVFLMLWTHVCVLKSLLEMFGYHSRLALLLVVRDAAARSFLTRYFQIFGSEKISTALPPKNFSKQLLFFKDTPLLIIPSQSDSNAVNLATTLNAIDAGVIWNGSSWPLQSLVTIISDTLPAAAISEKSIVLDVAPNDMGVVDMALLSHISSVVPDYFIIIAVIICVGVAACFLTNPKQDRYTLRIVVPAGSQEEFVYTEEEVSTVRNSIKIWSGDGLGDTEVLLFPVNKTAETGYTATYLTHGMSVEFDAENDTWFKIGVNMQNPTNEDIIVYVEVENVEVRIVDEINSVIEWFDYLETPDEMKWDGSLEISLTEFPDVTFRWTYGEMLAVKGSKSTSLYTGMPIWNAYFCDLTGDGLPELCSSISWGSGMIDNRVIIYDYANGVSYELSDRGYFDFTLRQDHQDGRLYVDKTKYHTDELVETGRLVFKNHCIQIEGFSNEAHQVFQAEILEIHDGNYLVKPVEGSWELSSADRIEVPIRNVHPSPEPEIGDVIEIEYAGEILETYPAQIADVYGIKVIEKNKGFTHLANDD